MNDVPSISTNDDFEKIKKLDNANIEYWTARELMLVLGYARWENFEEVIKRGMKACINSGQNVDNHFRKLTKMTTVGQNTPIGIADWKLDRYACYLIAQNGDSTKQQIAIAQTYFAIQTRRQEIFDQLNEVEKRLFIRGEVSLENKKLFSTAKKAGVSRFGYFNDAGYRGLYGQSLSDIEKHKGVKKGELLDRAGASELAANLFRITQTDEKLKKDNVKGDYGAARTHFMVGGKVRQTIKEIGGILPENIPAESHINTVKKEIKALKNTSPKIQDKSEK